MNKNNDSRSGFVNPRIFAAVALCAAGISMAMLSFASSPSSGTLTTANGPTTPLTYTAGPFTQPNVFGNSIAGECDPDPSDPLVPCDIFRLHVSLPAGWAQANPNKHLFVRIEWSVPAAVFDLYLWDAASWTAGSFPSGSPIAQSVQSATTFQQVEVPPDAVASGDYVVQVSTTFPAGQSFTGKIYLDDATVATVQPGGNASGIAPRFQEYIPTDANGAPSSSLGLFAGEPTMGVDTQVNFNKGGDVFYQGLYEILRIRFDDSTSPAKATWEFKDAPNGISNKATTDPILLTDPATGRIWAMQLAGGDSLTDISDDDGETWSPDISGGIGTGVDHEGMGVGPYPTVPPGSLIPHPLYQNAVYYCSQQVATAYCARSDDGGLTYGPIVPIYDSVTSKCVGLHGHPKVAPDGTVYVPNKGCGLDTPVLGQGLVNVVVSENAGVTWTIRAVPDSTGSLLSKGDPSVGIDKAGNAYLAYQNLNNNHLYVAVTHDKGVTYSPSVDVGALVGINYSVFPAVTAGDNGRAAVAFFGSTYNGTNTDFEDMSFPGVWYLYIATTYDGGNTWFVANTTPDNPIQGFGGIGNSGDNRNHYDFIDAVTDTQGRVIASNSIGCSAGCVNKGGPNSFSKLVGTVRQSGGRRMYAAFDPTEPALPAAPLLNGSRTRQFVYLNWPDADNSGSPITGYNVYQTIDGGTETKIYNNTTQRQLVIPANTLHNYSYRVTANNAIGEGPSSNTFAPTVGQNVPQLQLSCTLPGQVYLDRTGEGGAQPSNDIASFSIAEPYDMPGKLVFVINNVQPMLVQNGNSIFYVFFDPPSGGIRYRLRFSADPSAPLKEIATSKDNDFTNDPTPETGGEFRNWTVLPAGLDAASGIQPDGSVRFIIDKATLGINNGDVLLGVAVREDTAQDPSSVILSDYAGGRQDYTVVGNAFCTTPQVASRKTHGAAGVFDIDLTAGTSTEDRSGGANGNYTMVFTFPNTLTSVGGANIGSGSGSVANANIDPSDAHNYLVNLTGVTNAQVVTVNVSNIVDSAGVSISAVSGSMPVLIGDTNNDRFVNSADISQTKSQSGQPVGASNFREDVNVDGFINSADISLVKSKSGTAVP